nr:hypothetical protein [Tanacetum cinerariifolium]
GGYRFAALRGRNRTDDEPRIHRPGFARFHHQNQPPGRAAQHLPGAGRRGQGGRFVRGHRQARQNRPRWGEQGIAGKRLHGADY